jgi:hypothetical protein
MEAKIKLKNSIIIIPYNDSKSIERILQGVSELRKNENLKKDSKEEHKHL